MRYAALFLIMCMSLGFGHFSHAENSLRLTLPKAGTVEPESTSRFYEQALRLALSKTGTPSEQIQFNYYPNAVGRERARLLVKQGTVDVIWSSSNKKREEEFTAVKFNLIRGINEYRLLLIRADDQARFDKVNNLTDLQQLKIGSGTHWSDTEVYRFNALPLVTSYSYEPMFRMLDAKRFDYMARSLQEVNYELEHYGKLGLAIEKNLLIHYPQPIYFFLNKKNTALAARIQRGLEIAQEDGSLDAIFFNIPNFRQAWQQLQQLERKTIELKVNDQ